MKNAALVAGLGLLVFMVPRLVVAQNQRFVGTWKVDVAKSAYHPGPPPVVSADGKTMRGVSTAVTNQGQTTSEDVIYEKQ